MRLIAVLLLALCLTVPAMAQESGPSFNRQGTWYISWSGIPFAKLWISIEETVDNYRLTASYKSRGLVRIFSRSKSLTLSNGVRVGDTIRALEYNYENEDEDKHTLLQFDLAGELIRREVEPDDDPTHRPPVSAAEIKGAATPGDALFVLREMVRQAEKQGKSEFSVRFYEGKRLMLVTGSISQDTNYTINKKDYVVRKLTLSRELLSGFTDKEIKRYKKGEPPLYLYLDAETLFPIAMEVEIKLGTVKAEWRAE